MLQILLGEYSLIPKFIYLKIRRREGVESLTTLEGVSSRCPLTAALSELRKFPFLKLAPEEEIILSIPGPKFNCAYRSK